jgi:murein DD-endopeptidase MepM/ murein hydrolase activator NlpD
VAKPIVVESAFAERTDTLRRGEALATMLRRHGLDAAQVYRVVTAAPQLNPRRVRAGQVFEFRVPLGDDTPGRIATRLDDDRLLWIVRADSGEWSGRILPVSWRVQERLVSGVIATSLYDAFHQAIPDSILSRAELDRFITDLADGVFGWEIDFSRDVSEGDRFRVVYERLTSSLGDVRYGRLVAARVSTRGLANHAYVLRDEAGRNSYYDDRGVSLRRAFRRNPVAFLRISSGYTTRRRHPVLGTWRAHMGTDYAARPGTEIYATADGTVRLAGRSGGYGLMVAVRHVRGIETRYAHMSRIRAGIGPGVRVRQGQVIGYVGASGLANGPHVHYEFLQGGQARNPRAVDLGDGAPLPEARRAEFDSLRARYEGLLGVPGSVEPHAAGN